MFAAEFARVVFSGLVKIESKNFENSKEFLYKRFALNNLFSILYLNLLGSFGTPCVKHIKKGSP